jgi:serine/threonine protein kinase
MGDPILVISPSSNQCRSHLYSDETTIDMPSCVESCLPETNFYFGPSVRVERTTSTTEEQEEDQEEVRRTEKRKLQKKKTLAATRQKKQESKRQLVDSFTEKYLCKNKFTDEYDVAKGEVLGEGAFAVVHTGYHKKHSKQYAIKTVKKDALEQKDLRDLICEITITTRLAHPNIVRLHEAYEEPDYYYLVQELMTGGELFDRIVEKEFYHDREAQHAVCTILSAVNYMHSKKVVHRDLKPENLLLVSKDSDTNIKICDFGFATREVEPNSLTTVCGSPNYVAPEIVAGIPYGKQVDMWSLGTIVFLLLGGYAPFDEPDLKTQYSRIVEADYEYKDEYWEHASDDARDFIDKLLVVNPAERMTARVASMHKWITECEVEYNGTNVNTPTEKIRST